MVYNTLRRHLLKRFELIALTGGISAVVLVASVLDPLLSIKSAYIVVAALAVFLAQYFDSIRLEITEGRILRLSTITIFLFTATVFAFGANFLFVFAFLGFLSILIAINVLSNSTSKGLLFQGIVLMILMFVYFFANTGMYVGNVDPIWQHFPNIDHLVERGSIEALNERYQSFPLTHIAISAISLVTGLSPYHSSIPFLIGSGFVFGILAFLITKIVVNRQTAKYAALFVPGIYLIGFHLPIVFPQSMATLFVLFIFSSVYLPTKRRFYILGLLSAALVFTHHLTIFIFIVFSPLMYLMHRSERARVLYLVGLIALVHWLYLGESFILSIILAAGELTGNLLGPTPTTTTSLRTFGVDLVPETITSAVMFLGSLKGVYFAALGATLLCSAYYSLKVNSNYGPLISGVCAAIFVFENPLSGLRGMTRTGFAASFLVIPALCLGLKHLTQNRDHSNVLAAVLVLVLCMMGPALAMGFTPGNDTGIEHQNQRSLSVAQTSELAQVAEFQQRTGQEMTSFWVTSLYLSYLDADASQDVEPTSSGVTIPDGLFVYRMDWDRYRAGIYQPLGGVTILFSEEYLQHEVGRENQVYTSGNVRIVWYVNDQELNDN